MIDRVMVAGFAADRGIIDQLTAVKVRRAGVGYFECVCVLTISG